MQTLVETNYEAFDGSKRYQSFKRHETLKHGRNGYKINNDMKGLIKAMVAISEAHIEKVKYRSRVPPYV